MENHQGETRSTAPLPPRAPLEEAPTVMSRNPIKIDSELLRKNAAMAEAAEQATPAASDDRTHVSTKTPDSSGSSIASANPLKMGQSLEGEQLGHFMLEKFVGGGGMGAVFRALDTMLGRVVAVKVLSRERTDADTLRRFKNEAQSAARLDHKNIARVHYVSEDAGWNYIVFEFIEGVNIRDLVEQQGPLDLDDALNFTMQIAEALDHAAQREVVHRDIKPSNIIITPERRAKLVDMGLARLHQVESSHDDITASGVTLGTFDYISPEQARDPRAADVRSDIYSLGCTLYFMLCGRPPFPDGTVLQKLLSHNSDRPPDLRRFRPDLPDEMVDVVNRMLAKQPSARYQTPAELMTALVMLAQKYQLVTVAPPADVWTETKAPQVAAWERHVPWVAPVAILLLTVVIMEWGFPAAQPDLGKLRPLATPTEATANQSATDPSDTLPQPDSSTQRSGNPTPTEAEDDPATTLPATSPPPAETTNNDPVQANNVIDSGRSPAEPRQPATPPAEEPTDPSPTVVEQPAEEPQPLVTEPSPEPTVPAVPARANVIVVTRDSQTDAEIARQLQDALRRAATSSTIDTIELDFDGPVTLSGPLLVDATDVEISAARGSQPELVFALERLSNSAAMLIVESPTFRLTRVRLSLSVAEDSKAADGWSMISLGPNAQRMIINDSVLTFENPIVQFDNGSAFVRLNHESLLTDGNATETTATNADPIEIELNRTIARGEATFLRAAHGQACSINWTQGLLATSERLLDMENLAAEAGLETADQPVRISLTHVTAVADKGICRVGANSQPQSIPLPLDVELNACVVRTSPDVPLFDQLQVNPTSDAGMLFIWEPSGTLFSRSRYVHRFAGVLVGERLRTDSMKWENPLPTSKPWHEHVTSDYFLTGEDPLLLPGFDRERMPPIASQPSASETLPTDSQPL